MLVKGDATDPAATVAMLDSAEKAYGGTELAVDNAGVTLQAQIAELDDATAG